LAPVDPRVETIRLLTSIDATMKSMLVCLQTGIVSAVQSATSSGPAVNLDSEHGDPIVKAKDPRDWTGEPMRGKKFSECPPAYLDMLADRYDYFAEREEDPKKAGYNRLDAARARGWAARKRAGWTPPVQSGRVDETQGEPTW
jgi:hypothetical protein